MPLTATTAPAASACWVAASAVSDPLTGPDCDQNHSDGPQSGQAMGCAWNRRSAGLWYSAAHRSHMVNADMVVAGRSYGNSRMTVNRGPQFVQVEQLGDTVVAHGDVRRNRRLGTVDNLARHDSELALTRGVGSDFGNRD